MSYFWAATDKNSYIEPKRPYQMIGIIDFIQPFLIQSMTKPSVTIDTTNVTKILKNGTLRKENHYQSNYSNNSITIKAIDAYDSIYPGTRLNAAQKLYTILTDGGYTADSNEVGAIKDYLRFPSFRILELAPRPKTDDEVVANAIASTTAGVLGALSGQGIGNIINSALNGATSGLEFLDPQVAGVYTLLNPVFTSVDFGEGLNYSSDGLVNVSITINYSNFKYEKSTV